MKVLKVGKWNNPWSGTFTCETCSAELFVEESDLQPQGNKHDANYYTCMECNHTNYIDGKLLPLRVKEVLNKKRKHWDTGDPF